MNKLLDKVALSQLLGMSVAALNKRKPHQLPPRVDLPGSRLIRWRIEDVKAWIDAHVVLPPPPPTAEPPKRGRGRPRKGSTTPVHAH